MVVRFQKKRGRVSPPAQWTAGAALPTALPCSVPGIPLSMAQWASPAMDTRREAFDPDSTGPSSSPSHRDGTARCLVGPPRPREWVSQDVWRYPEFPPVDSLFPAFGTDYGRTAFAEHLTGKGADASLVTRVSDRVGALNEKITRDQELGPGFQIDHSYFVPSDGDEPSDAWYNHIITTQIAPLLREYWFDSPEDVEKEVARLTADA